ncbi:uncharacterized protein LOC114306784 isoform X2 [Camellia sinensis]|uniref:Cullin N-terminal domain-containing protein n=1 Tax=Camellia sinensis TaxID=4442 RepID=A0A7J7I5C2_CAMSI|nr:uncharacterized protein LOC114306784 isoform X2 [Camellia sinensis]KAF5959318.1 hypothetical protein HYC85_000527 [Camellia sinensis]
MSAQKKRNFQIEAFKHRVVVDPKYAEKTWKILEHAIQEIYNHKIGCVLSLSLSPWAHCLHCLVSTTCSFGFRVIVCLNMRFSSFIGVPRWENESAFCKLKTWRCSGSERMASLCGLVDNSYWCMEKNFPFRIELI